MKMRPLRRIVTLSLISVAVGVLVVADQKTVAVGTQRIADENFTGGGPTLVDSEDINTIRVRVDAGARSNWHSHTWGQLLLVEEGRGRPRSESYRSPAPESELSAPLESARSTHGQELVVFQTSSFLMRGGRLVKRLH